MLLTKTAHHAQSAIAISYITMVGVSMQEEKMSAEKKTHDSQKIRIITMKETGESIKQARLQRGWTQDALAKKLNVTQAYISELESGVKTASPRMARALETLFMNPDKFDGLMALSDNLTELEIQMLELFRQLPTDMSKGMVIGFMQMQLMKK